MVKKIKILTLMDLDCLKNAKKPDRCAHCWKAYLIGYNFVKQKIALKCNPDFPKIFFFFVKLVKKPVFCQ